MTVESQEYVVAVMETPLEPVKESFHELVDAAVKIVEKLLTDQAVFSLLAVAAATALIYRAYGLPTSAVRSRVMAESIIVSKAATLITLLLTMIGMYAGFFVVAYLAIILIFPRDLMQTWPTVGPAVRIIDHVRLGMFMAAMGVLAGSLGGRAENKEVIRHILFIDEET